MIDWDVIGTFAFAPDLEVRRVGFGGAWLTGPGTYGPPKDWGAARDALRRAVDAGVQLVDTADCYGPELSERLIAETFAPYADGIVISTKGGRIALGNNRWRANGRPDHLKQACDGSLRRLRLDRIDLYQLNAVDPDVPLEDSLGALADLRHAGKIGHIGICNVDVEQLDAALGTTQTRTNQSVLRECERRCVAFLPWFSVPTRSAL